MQLFHVKPLSFNPPMSKNKLNVGVHVLNCRSFLLCIYYILKLTQKLVQALFLMLLQLALQSVIFIVKNYSKFNISHILGFKIMKLPP
jgi:hypothetical protein